MGRVERSPVGVELLEDKEVQERILNAFSERRDIRPYLTAAGITFRDLGRYARDHKEFREALEEARMSFAEDLFAELCEDLKLVDEVNFQAKKAKADMARYLLKVLNPSRYIEKSEVAVKSQMVVPIVKVTFAALSEKDRVIELPEITDERRDEDE